MLLGLLLLAPPAGWTLGWLAGGLHRPPAPPLVLILVPGLGAADLEAGLRDGSLPGDGLMRHCMRWGQVCRRITPGQPPTSAALLGTLLSGRIPAATGVTMSRLPSPHRRLSATVPGLHTRRLRWVLPRERPLRPTLALGLPPDLLPLEAHQVGFHVHGRARNLTLHPALLEDPLAAGWILPHGFRSGLARSMRLRVPDTDGADWMEVDLLLADAGTGIEGSGIHRNRDALSGRLPRSGGGWWARTGVSCRHSPTYHEVLDLVLTLEGSDRQESRLVVSEYTHLGTNPPGLAARLQPSPPVCRPGTSGRWRDAERLGVLEGALDLAEHERLICLLEGPGLEGEARALDRRLQRLATKVRDRQGLLVVVGLGRGASVRGGLDLPGSLPAALGPAMAGDLAVVAEEGVARVELGRPTRGRRARLEIILMELVGPGARLEWVGPGSLSVQAPPGVSLDGRTRRHVMGGSGPLSPHAGLLLLSGHALPRHQQLELTAVEVHHWLRQLWTGQQTSPHAGAGRDDHPPLGGRSLSACAPAPASSGPP